MINKNYKAICQSIFKSYTTSYGLYTTEGNLINYTFSSTQNNTIVVADSGYRYIFLGSGTSQPTVNDIAMDSVIDNLTLLSKFSYPNKTSGTVSTDNNYIQTMGITVRNDTEASITVNEIGWGMRITSGATAIFGDYLFGREVITPVTIAPDETYSFTITIG